MPSSSSNVGGTSVRLAASMLTSEVRIFRLTLNVRVEYLTDTLTLSVCSGIIAPVLNSVNWAASNLMYRENSLK